LPILLLDVLGVKKRWELGGRDSAEPLFKRLRALTAAILRDIPERQGITGAVESDAILLAAEKAEPLLTFAHELYRHAWLVSSERHDNLWFRGVLVPAIDLDNLRMERHLNEPLSGVSIFLYSDAVFEAIQAEKSGFAGMRLLVHKTLSKEGKSRPFQIETQWGNFSLLRKLRHSHYPSRLAADYLDYLWMADESVESWDKLANVMSARLRWSSRDPDAFRQAASTQVVFHETNAMIGRMRINKRIGRKKKAPAD
jgi:hypothetical protein